MKTQLQSIRPPFPTSQMRLEMWGGVNIKYKPRDMVQAILDLNHVENCKRWTVNVPEPMEATTTLLSGDEWLAKYWNDERLCIAIIPVGTSKGAYRNFGGAIQTNHPIIETQTGNVAYGMNMSNSGSQQTPGASVTVNPVWNSTQTHTIRVTQDGDVIAYAPTGYTINAGDYSIVAWLI